MMKTAGQTPAYRRLIILFLLLAIPVFFAGNDFPEPLSGIGWRILAAGAAALTAFAIVRTLPTRKTAVTLATVFFGGYLLLEFAEMSSFLISGETFDFQYYYHFRPGTLLYGSFGYHAMLACALIYWMAGTGAAAWVLARTPSARENAVRGIGGAVILLSAALLIFGDNPSGNLIALLRSLNRGNNGAELDFDAMRRWGIKPTLIVREQIRATPGKNLIFIYLESMEAAYLDERVFPGLLPNLQKLIRDEALFFTGIHESERARFTFGALFSSLTGNSLTAGHLRGDGNSGIDPAFGNRLSSLPGILRNAGYSQLYLSGQNPSFAGTDVLLETLGYDALYSGAELLGGNREWGMRDRELFECALEMYRKLEKEGRPFQITLAAIDGHNPDGFTEPDGPRYSPSPYPQVNLLNAHHATDHFLGKLIERLKREPGWPNTVVFIMSDHLMMQHDVMTPVLRSRFPDRKLLALALNTGYHGIIDVPGKTFDIAPTLLELLGVRHNFLFPLGENLLSGAPDPRRLTGDSPEAEETLQSYLRFKSARKLDLTEEVRVKLSPRPRLEAGNIQIPVFQPAWGLQELPHGPQFFVARLTPDGELLEFHCGDTREEAERIAADTAARYLILTPPTSPLAEKIRLNAEFPLYLVFGGDGKWKAVGAVAPEELKLRPVSDE